MGRPVESLVTFVRTLGPARLAAMGAVAAAMIGFFAFIILRVTAPQMAMLYSELPVEDSAAIVKELERQGVPYELRNDGAIIFVPKDRIGRLRMKLAEGGLPKGGGVGYEIFDKSDALGTTSFVQNINHLRALEGELARTIRAIDRVQSARVHLVLPERALFAREKAEPSASIAVKVRGQLETQQVRAIRHLVASAVNGLKPERVSIVDETGRLLADGAGQDVGGAGAGDERKSTYERRLREQVESIVSSVVGAGRARVQLTADFDYNRVTQTQERFDPEGRVMRSSQSREETAASAGEQGQVTVGNELPNANAGQNQPAAREQSKKSEEIVNYEISRTTKTETIEGGRVSRISVAVLVDGVYGRTDKGELLYQERPKEELDRIAALVRSAIGFDQKRGDQIEIVNLRFAEPPAAPIPEPTGWASHFQVTKEDILRAIELGVMLMLGLVVLLFVVRPLVRRIVTPEHMAALASALPGATAALPVGAVEGAGAGGGVAVGEAAALAGGPSETSRMIEIAQVQGTVHAQSIQKVGELADRNPQETVSIIRQWLHEKP